MKNSNQANKPRASNRKLWMVIVLVLGAGALALCGALIYFGNRAEQVAAPLEAGLAKAGALKLCATGDNGRGWDNPSPHYGVSYKLNRGKDQAMSLIYNVVTQNGFHPTHASPANRGALAVADAYIDNWYFDNTSKQNPYGDISDGPIKLSFVIYGEGEKESCTQTIIEPGHSVVGIGVQLPPFKR